jgi:ribosomal protein S9
MEIYPESEKNKYCMCGALLQVVEIEIKPKTNKQKKNADAAFGDNRQNDKKKSGQAKGGGEKRKASSETRKTADGCDSKTNEVIKESPERKAPEPEVGVNQVKASLYLLLDNDDIRFDVSDIVKIGRETEENSVDIDLSAYAGKDVSRQHAVIKREKDGYYITNVSKNHSVRIIDQDDNETALEYGKKVRLKSEDGILLSKKILLQFVEEK